MTKVVLTNLYQESLKEDEDSLIQNSINKDQPGKHSSRKMNLGRADLGSGEGQGKSLSLESKEEYSSDPDWSVDYNIL